MKNKLTVMVTSLALIALLFSACEKTHMEKAQDAYDASMVVPKVLGTTGTALALQTFTYDYSLNYFRAGSTWNWSAVDAVVKTVSADTRTASVLFDKLPVSGKAQIKVTETTAGGTISPEMVIEVTVNPFCPLETSGFVGSWTGTDGGDGGETYPSAVTTTLDGTKILVDGLNTGFMDGFWEESIVLGGTCLMTVNPDGTLTIPEQFFCDTETSLGYKIKGTGTWDNCGATPTLIINYDIWFPDDDFWIAEHYGASYFEGKKILTANLSLVP